MGDNLLPQLVAPPPFLSCRANFLGKAAGDAPHVQHGAICLETQNYPNAVNTPGFPEAVLQPGQQYRVTTVHAFVW